MTRTDLDALEKLADEATPGPWAYEGIGYTDDGGQYREVTSSAEVIFGEWGVPSEQNAAFIAAADPATIKALIAELKEARGLMAAIATSRVTEDNPYLWKWASTVIIKARAFLARNEKGEG